MKPGIHPESRPVVFRDRAAASHPFRTGTQRVVDTAGRIQRYGRGRGAQ